ncbi:MAG: BREX system ATP-binding domain-containing protein, partial [Polyangiaceae bacterium]
MPKIGPYVIIDTMAQGGDGIVCKARHEQTGGLAAVKSVRDASGRHRDFLRKEVLILSLLGRARHPGVVRVLESGNDRGVLWYAMEFVDGADLASFNERLWQRASFDRGSTTEYQPETGLLSVTEGGLAHSGVGRQFLVPAQRAVAQRPRVGADRLRDALDVVSKLAAILALVHAEGLVHGDVKPKNVLLRRDGEPVLVDFGTALYAFAGAASREVAQIEGLKHGTPGYMAPEQILGEPLDARCDLYALGCILFELMTGTPPFCADSAHALIDQHMNVTPPLPSSIVDDVPPALDQLVLNLLAKQREERIGYAQDVVDALGAFTGAGSQHTAPRLPYRARMVGRETDARRLLNRLARVRDGDGALLFVAGESGAGKTRFVNELGVRALGLGMEVVIGQCTDSLQTATHGASPGTALHAFVPLLQRVSDLCSDDPDGPLLRSLASELSVLAPYESSIAAVAPPARRPPELPYALARRRVLASLNRVIRALGEIQPLLLILDDLHWADDLTLDFLQGVAVEGFDGANVCLLATYRSEQVAERLRRLAEDEPGRTLVLQRLGLDAIASMARDMLAASMLPEGLAEFLHSHSEGNPFFAAEYLRSAISCGLVVRTPKREWVLSLPARSERDVTRLLPESLSAVLEGRLAGLSSEASSLLELAAILGREFDLELLQAVVSRDGDTGFDTVALEELKARQVIESVTQKRFRFVHDKLREACVGHIQAERRITLHTAIARRLESMPEGSVGSVDAARLGRHWAHAGEAVRAFGYLEHAAQHAESIYANDEACELYRLAISQGEVARIARERLRDLAAAAADLLARIARHAEARSFFDRALALTMEQERLVRACLHRKCAQSYWTVHRYEHAKASLDAALQALGRERRLTDVAQRREWIEIQLGYFWRAYFARQTGPVTRRIIRRMTPRISDGCATDVQRSSYYVCAGLDILGRRRYAYSARAVDYMRRALALLDGQPTCAVEAALARFNLGFALLLGARALRLEAVSHLARTAADAARFGDATLRARALTYLAVAHRRAGDLRNTEDAAQSALQAADSAQLKPYLAAANSCLAWVRLAQNDEEQVLTLAQAARRWWTESDHAFPFRWLASLPLLEVSLRHEDFDTARMLVGDLLSDQQQRLPVRLFRAVDTAARLLDTPSD